MVEEDEDEDESKSELDVDLRVVDRDDRDDCEEHILTDDFRTEECNVSSHVSIHINVPVLNCVKCEI